MFYFKAVVYLCCWCLNTTFTCNKHIWFKRIMIFKKKRKRFVDLPLFFLLDPYSTCNFITSWWIAKKDKQHPKSNTPTVPNVCSTKPSKLVSSSCSETLWDLNVAAHPGQGQSLLEHIATTALLEQQQTMPTWSDQRTQWRGWWFHHLW